MQNTIKSLYDNDLTTYEIADIIGKSQWYVHNQLIALGVQMRAPGRKAVNYDSDILNMYVNQNMSMRQISRKLKVSIGVINRTLKKWSVVIEHRTNTKIHSCNRDIVHYMADNDYTIHDIASKMHVSLATIYRNIKTI
jgi:predicted DNA-binding protein YlxM (UPF0122 family)